MAINYATEIEAIKVAIASGATHVTYDGKSVQYDSFEKMLARLRWLEAQAAGGAVAQHPTAAFASFDRGDS